jgi:DNA modification methylase
MSVRILVGDCRAILRTIEAGSVHSCVSSPPYFNLRDYEAEDQIGMEETPDAFVAAMVEVFREVRRALRDDGTLWLNLGDSYASTSIYNSPRKSGDNFDQITAPAQPTAGTPPGLKPKDLIGIPWRVAFALQADGWFLRSEIIWAKPNGMPGSQEDRCTSSHETIFMFSKSANYWSDFDAIKTPPREATLVRTAQNVQAQAGSHRASGGRKTNGPMKSVGGVGDKQSGHGRNHAGFNARWDRAEAAGETGKPAMMRDVWFVSPGGFAEAHFAVMPDEIARRCILAGSPTGGCVLDPFGGAGTTGLVAARLGRSAVLIELNPEYAGLADRRLRAGLAPVDGPPLETPETAGPLFDVEAA